MTRIAPACVLAIQFASWASATTYHVSVDGRDHGHSGSIREPFLSIRRGVLAATRPGDEVVIGPGIYVPHDVITLPHSGTSANPIVIRGQEGAGRVIVDGTRLYADPAVFRVAASHVVLEGLEIQNKSDFGIKIAGRGARIQDVLLRRLRVSNCGYAGIMLWSERRDDPLRRIRVEECTVFNCSLVNGVDASSSWSGCVAMVVQDLEFRDNLVYENHGEGIVLAGCTRCQVAGNSFRDNFRANVLIENSRSVALVGNSIVTDNGQRASVVRAATIGIELANRRDLELPPSQDITIRGNWLLGNSCGIRFTRHRGPGGLKGVTMERNLIDSQGGPAVWFSAAADHVESSFRGNLVVQRTGPPAIVPYASSGLRFCRNIWVGTRPPPTARSRGDIVCQ